MSAKISYLNIIHIGKQTLKRENYKIFLKFRNTASYNWEDPEGSGREGGGRGDRDGEYM